MRYALPIVLLLLAFIPGCDEHAEDKEAIRAVWTNFNRCNDTADGNGIIQYFTESSFANNERLLKIVLDGTPAQVKALPLFDRMEVLRARMLSNRKELTGLDGRGYVRFATSKGWYVMPVEWRTNDTLPKITFSKSGEEAWAPIHSDGKRTSMRVHFIKEGGLWRYDEPEAMIEYSNDMAREAREEGIPENQYMLDLLEEELGRPIPESVWQPMP